MLILIAGISGHLGRLLADHGLAKGHQIRGFGRSPSKLPPQILEQLESFVQCEDYDDKETLVRAVSGADAVICSYFPSPSAVLESQLSLLRASEREGIKIFVAHCWNNNWSRLPLGCFDFYDAHLSSRRHVELTSSIKPVFVLTGTFTEMAISENFGLANIEVGDDGHTNITFWGDGENRWSLSYMSDAAKYTIDLVTTNMLVLAGEGGSFHMQSIEVNTKECGPGLREENRHGTQTGISRNTGGCENRIGSCSKAGGAEAAFLIGGFNGQKLALKERGS